jgi:hypothetical protein
LKYISKLALPGLVYSAISTEVLVFNISYIVFLSKKSSMSRKGNRPVPPAIIAKWPDWFYLNPNDDP